MKRARAAAWRLVAAAGMLATAAHASATTTAPPGLSGFEQLTLDNGMRVLLGTPARPVAFTEALLLVQAGTSSPGHGQEERAKIVAEAFLGGRLADDKATIKRHLARAGVTLDYTVGREVAVFRFAVPTRNTASFLRFLTALLVRESLGEEAWREAVARRQQAGAREQADTWRRSLDALEDLVWQAPAAGAPPAGPDPLTALDLSSLEAFRSSTYAPDRMVLCLWGDTPISKLREMVRQEIGRVRGRPRRDPAPEVLEPVLKTAGGLKCIQASGAEPPVLLFAVGAELEDDRSFYGWQLVAHILGASHASRLHDRLRVREPFVYTVEASCTPVGSRGLTLHISAQTDALEPAREAIAEEVQRLLDEEVSREEFDLARAIFRSRLLLDQGSFRDQFYRRALSLLSSRPQRDLDRGEEALNALTPASLRSILRRTLRPESTTIVVVSAKEEALCQRGSS